MFTVQDLQRRYGVSVHTVLGWIARGELRAINVGVALGKKKPRWRVTPEALAEWERLRTPTPPLPKVRRRKRDDTVIEFYRS